jgi:hypothetical protein
MILGKRRADTRAFDVDYNRMELSPSITDSLSGGFLILKEL